MSGKIVGSVRGQVLHLIYPPLVEGTVNYLTAEFSFSGDWDGLSKWAHFKQGSTIYDVPLTNDAITEDQHLNLSAGTWDVYLHGSGDNRRITTTTVRMKVLPYLDEDGEPLPEVPLTFAEVLDHRAQRIQAVAHAVEAGESARKEAERSRELSEFARVQAEAERTGAEAGRASAETERASAETARASAENARSSAEDTRRQNEGARQAAEAIREQNEEARVEAEKNRKDGKSAYQYAVEGGYTGTEAEFAAKLSQEIPTIDPTLTQTGQAADAKATGDALRSLSEEIVELDTTLSFSGKAADAKAVGDALNKVTSGVVVGRFFGKVANFLGDSQTDDAGNYKSVFFYDWLKDILGLSATNNYGYSGTTIMPIDGQNRSFLERYTSMDDAADLIVVWGGTNDYHYGHALGTPSDTGNTTFCGALNNLCKGLIEKYPQKGILFVTPTPRGEVSGAVATQEEYADAIIKVCGKYCIPVFDAFRNCQMPIVADTDRRYTVDGLHLNDLGHEILGKSIANYILYGPMAGVQEAFQTVAVTGVTLDKTTASIEVGGTVHLTASVEPLDATNKNVVWSTSNSGVATVVNGLITGVADGLATITVKTVYGNKIATCAVTVGSGQEETSISVTGVTLDKSEYSLVTGETVQLTATVTPTDATNQNVSWGASNGNCTVNNGLVTAVSAGDCTIIATTEDGNFTASCVITVSEPVADAPESPVDGKTVTFTASSSYPSNANNLTLLVNASDCPSGKYNLTVRAKISDATQNITAYGKGLQAFQDETGELNNGAFKTPAYSANVANIGTAYVVSELNDGNLVGNAGTSETALTYPYVKIPVSIVPAAWPVSFKIESLTVDINGTYIPVQAVGGFYADEGYSESQSTI